LFDPISFLNGKEIYGFIFDQNKIDFLGAVSGVFSVLIVIFFFWF